MPQYMIHVRTLQRIVLFASSLWTLQIKAYSKQNKDQIDEIMRHQVWNQKNFELVDNQKLCQNSKKEPYHIL